jgi:hypothetical protein
MITLRRYQKDGRDYYQVVLVRPGVEIQSPLLTREDVVRWVMWALNAPSPSPSPSKAG